MRRVSSRVYYQSKTPYLRRVSSRDCSRDPPGVVCVEFLVVFTTNGKRRICVEFLVVIAAVIRRVRMRGRRVVVGTGSAGGGLASTYELGWEEISGNRKAREMPPSPASPATPASSPSPRRNRRQRRSSKTPRRSSVFLVLGPRRRTAEQGCGGCRSDE